MGKTERKNNNNKNNNKGKVDNQDIANKKQK